MGRIITLIYLLTCVSTAMDTSRPLLGQLLEEATNQYTSPLWSDDGGDEAETQHPISMISLVQQQLFASKQLKAIRQDEQKLSLGIREAVDVRHESQQQLVQERLKLQKLLHNIRKLKQYSAPLVMITSRKKGDFVATMVLLRSIIPQTYAQMRECADSANAALVKSEWQTKKLLKLRRVLAELRYQQRLWQDNLAQFYTQQEHGIKPSGLMPAGWVLPVFNVQELDLAYVTGPASTKKLLSCQSGVKVYAPCNGEVLYCADLGSQGNAVFIRHDSAVVVLSGLGQVDCRAGDQLQAGQELGNMPKSKDGAMHYLYYEIWWQAHEA